VGKVVNGQFKKGWLYQDQLNPVAELDSDGNVISRFIYGTNGHVPDYIVKNDSTYRFITDHLGSVRLVVNTANGHIIQRLDYDEFGNVLVNTNEGFQPFGYAGGLFDEQTGLVRFGARDYDAVVGRWTAKDPILLSGGINFYLYNHNYPINSIDPYGLKDYIIVNASLSGGIGPLSLEGGSMFVVDPANKDVYEFLYFGIGPGVSTKVAAGVALEVGIFDLEKPTDPAGLGWQISGFAASGKGVAGFISGNFFDFFGSGAGISGGAGANISALGTITDFKKKISFNNLPKRVQNAIKKFMEEHSIKNICK